MSKKPPVPAKTIKKRYFYPLATVLLLLLLVFNFLLYFYDEIYPGVSVAQVSLMGQTKDQAKQLLKAQLQSMLNTPVNLELNGQKFSLDLSSEVNDLDLDTPINQAFLVGRSKLLPFPASFNLEFKLNDTISKQLQAIKEATNLPAQDAKLAVKVDSIELTPSSPGSSLDEEVLKKWLAEYINTGKLPQSTLPTKVITPKVNTKLASSMKAVLEQVKAKPIKVVYQELSWELDFDSLWGLIDLDEQLPPEETKNNQPDIKVRSVGIEEKAYSERQVILNPEKLDQFLAKISKEVDRPVQEPVFDFDGKKVSNFKPPLDGRSVEVKKAAQKIQQSLAASPIPDTIELPVTVVNPKNQLVNEQGIKELIGQGDSNFAGSIPNRIYNLSLAASRVDGTIIPPDGVFSFNETVGDISAATGYKQAYVIKSGRTVLDDGGGVCQVSTTIFRAALNAGLPIVTRTAHAYRVGYYEQGYPPGLDATTYYPSVDLKFKNDTGHSILVQAYVNGLSLHVEFYGTSDGRVASISTPVITNQTPPPAELRQDDPTLPKGTVKQVDWPAWGARVVFSRSVTRGNEQLIKESFVSNYKPWQAVFLVGTKE